MVDTWGLGVASFDIRGTLNGVELLRSSSGVSTDFSKEFDFELLGVENFELGFDDLIADGVFSTLPLPFKLDFVTVFE